MSQSILVLETSRKTHRFKLTFAIDFKACTKQFPKSTKWNPLYFNYGANVCYEILNSFRNLHQAGKFKVGWKAHKPIVGFSIVSAARL